jgi:hypothetical protein
MKILTPVGQHSHPIFCRTTSTVGQHSVGQNGPSDNTTSNKTHLTDSSTVVSYDRKKFTALAPDCVERKQNLTNT